MYLAYNSNNRLILSDVTDNEEPVLGATGTATVYDSNDNVIATVDLTGVSNTYSGVLIAADAANLVECDTYKVIFELYVNSILVDYRRVYYECIVKGE